MTSPVRIPTLRAGRPYYSLDTEVLRDIRSGDPLAEVSVALPGMIARDLRDSARNQRVLAEHSIAEIIAICRRAAEIFSSESLPLGEHQQTADEYVSCLAATTGMPEVMGRANMGKIAYVLGHIENVLDGLTRGLDLSVLDEGWGYSQQRRLSYQRLADNLGAILPNNSPGVHNLWIPAIALKMPLVLKPGSSEPWTPHRIAGAMIAAGAPPEAFGLYSTSHAGATEILTRTDRSLFFGDAATVRGWKGSGKVQLHGPGWSKVILGNDAASHWQEHLDTIAESVAANGGRSCINASGVWTATNGEGLANGLAQRLAEIEALPLDHPQAKIAAFADPSIAHRISEMIDGHLAAGGAIDITAQYRQGGRVVEAGGCTFLLPTVVFCESPEHPLASSEFLFPFVAVVEVAPDELLGTLGPTLIGSVITDDEQLRRSAIECRDIDRLNLGSIPTYQISWDQPHEGNLFDHLYQQRAFQTATAS